MTLYLPSWYRPENVNLGCDIPWMGIYLISAHEPRQAVNLEGHKSPSSHWHHDVNSRTRVKLSGTSISHSLLYIGSHMPIENILVASLDLLAPAYDRLCVASLSSQMELSNSRGTRQFRDESRRSLTHMRIR